MRIRATKTCADGSVHVSWLREVPGTAGMYLWGPEVLAADIHPASIEAMLEALRVVNPPVGKIRVKLEVIE